MSAEFVFTTFEFGGHVTPALWVARRLADRGRRVLVVSDEATRPEAEGFGLPFQPWTTAPNRLDKDPAHEPLRDWEAQEPADLVAMICAAVMTGPAAAYASDTAAVLDAHPGACLVSQELLLGCMAGAQARGRRLALLTANIWPLPTLAGVPPFGPGLEPPVDEQGVWFQGLIRQAARDIYDLHLDPLNAGREAVGLPRLAKTLDQLDAAELILISTAAAFDFAPNPLPAPFRYAGPQARVPSWSAEWESPWPADDPRPLVLVSFSTLYQAQEDAIRRVIVALSALPVRGLVTLGPQLDPGDFVSSDAVRVVRSASHDALMPEVAAMVTHAGHGSAIRPILHGVPLLCLPMGRDQPDNAARIAARGAGLRLPPDAEPAAIAAAVQRLLTEPDFRDAAGRWGEAIRTEVQHSGDVAVDALEALMARDVKPSFAARG